MKGDRTKENRENNEKGRCWEVNVEEYGDRSAGRDHTEKEDREESKDEEKKVERQERQGSSRRTGVGRERKYCVGGDVYKKMEEGEGTEAVIRQRRKAVKYRRGEEE